MSEWSSTTEEDIDAPQTAAAQPRQLQKSDWYLRVKEGKHLPEMRKLHSYICGGKADWTKDLAGIVRSKKSATTKAKIAASASQLETFKKKRMSLLEARTRLFRGKEKSVHRHVRLFCAHLVLINLSSSLGLTDLISFANGTSKWNERIPSSRSLDAERIFRFIEQTKNGQRFHIKDLVRCTLVDWRIVD